MKMRMCMRERERERERERKVNYERMRKVESECSIMAAIVTC